MREMSLRSEEERVLFATHPLVDAALGLVLRHPEMPAAEVLRQAVANCNCAGTDFTSIDPVRKARPHPAYQNELDPPSPFAELLRRTYAPHLDPRELLFIALGRQGSLPECEDRIEKALVQWEVDVLQPFEDQYGLLSGRLA